MKMVVLGELQEQKKMVWWQEEAVVPGRRYAGCRSRWRLSFRISILFHKVAMAFLADVW